MNVFGVVVFMFDSDDVSVCVCVLYVQIVVFVCSHSLTLCLEFGPNLIVTYVEAYQVSVCSQIHPKGIYLIPKTNTFRLGVAVVCIRHV
jgi:hypothetical protein